MTAWRNVDDRQVVKESHSSLRGTELFQEAWVRDQPVRLQAHVIFKLRPLNVTHSVTEYALDGVTEFVLRHHANVVLVAFSAK